MDNNAIPDSNWIPEGFVEITGPSGEHYLVPQFYAPALNNTLDGLDEKRKMEIEKAAGTVSTATRATKTLTKKKGSGLL